MPAVFEIGVREEKERAEAHGTLSWSARSWGWWNLHGGGSAHALVGVAVKDSDRMLCCGWRCSASPTQRNLNRLGWGDDGQRSPSVKKLQQFFSAWFACGYGEKEKSIPETSRCAGTPEWLGTSRTFCFPYKVHMAFQIPDDMEGNLRF